MMILPLPSDAWATALSANDTPEDQRTDAQRAAQALARSLAEGRLPVPAVAAG